MHRTFNLGFRSARPQRQPTALLNTHRLRPRLCEPQPPSTFSPASRIRPVSTTVPRRYPSNPSNPTIPSPPLLDTADMAPKAPKFELKNAKGTRDWSGSDMVIRDKIFNAVSEVFSASLSPPSPREARAIPEIGDGARQLTGWDHRASRRTAIGHSGFRTEGDPRR